MVGDKISKSVFKTDCRKAPALPDCFWKRRSLRLRRQLRNDSPRDKTKTSNVRLRRTLCVDVVLIKFSLGASVWKPFDEKFSWQHLVISINKTVNKFIPDCGITYQDILQ